MSTEARSRPVFKGIVLDAVTFGFLLLMILVGAFQPDDEQMLNLYQNFMVFMACLVFGGALGFGLNKVGIKSLGEAVFEPDYKKRRSDPVPFLKTFWGWQLLIISTLAFVVGLRITEFSLHEILSADGFSGAQRIFSSLLNPNFDILPQAVLAIIETIFIAFIATVFAIPFSFFLSFLCSKNIMENSFIGAFIYGVLRTVLNVTRSIEPLIWAIIFSVWVGIGPFAGMLALWLHTIASLTKQYAEQVECVEQGPIEGIQSTGAGMLQTLWYAVVPQILLPFVAFTIFRWDINVRMATIIGLVGGGGIGTMLIQYQGQALWNEVGCLILLIAVVVWLMDTGSAYIREAIK